MLLDTFKKQIMGILNKYPISKAAIFGSFARGEENKSSDIDLLIVILFRTLMQQNNKLSTLEIIRALDKMQIAEIEHQQNMPTVFMRTPLTENQFTILNHLKITQLKNIESASSLSSRLLYQK